MQTDVGSFDSDLEQPKARVDVQRGSREGVKECNCRQPQTGAKGVIETDDHHSRRGANIQVAAAAFWKPICACLYRPKPSC